MKVNLVVATGVHEGKAITLPGPQFVIGRDQECHLRPASPAVSKKHCLIQVRDGRVFVKDLGSTNGSFLNDTQLTEETEAFPGDRLRVGPLDFSLKFVPVGSSVDVTPLPEAMKSVPQGGRPSDAGAKPLPPAASPGTPLPMSKSQAAKPPQPAAVKISSPGIAIPKAGSPIPKPSSTASADDIAAAMMAEDDASDVSVPDGSTVMDLPAIDAEKLRMAGQDPSKAGSTPAGGKKPMSSEDSSNVASEILRKYMKRPK